MDNMDEDKNLPLLGTAEAAVQTCVNLISRATGQPEDRLAYWLDLYYQVRSAYESEEARRQQEQRNMDTIRALCSPRMTDKPQADAPEPPDEPEGSPPPPPTPKTNAANAAFKRETRERLLQMRAEGLTTVRLMEQAKGLIKEGTVRDIIDARTVPLTAYRKLAKVLDKIQTAT